jgi:ribosomal protein L7/L12
MHPIPPPPAVAEALARGEIIKAIKLWRDHSGVDLRSAKQQVDAWLQAGASQAVAEMLNRQAGGPAATAVAATDPDGLPPAARRALAQGQMLQAIKLTREQYPEMGLREAKDLVERHRDRAGGLGPDHAHARAPDRSAPPAGTSPTVASGDRAGTWWWWAVILLVAAAVFWWLRR